MLLICLTAMFLKRSERLNDLALELAQEDSLPGKQVQPDQYPEIPAGAFLSMPLAAKRTTQKEMDQHQRNRPTGLGERQQILPAQRTRRQAFSQRVAQTNGNGGRQLVSVLPNGGPLSSQLVEILTSPPASTTPAVRPTEVPQDPFILQAADGTTKNFRTLKAAVADAKSGDVVLLRYNGYPDDLPARPPVRIVGMNLIIRAAEGFRPTLEFDGVSEGTVTPGADVNLRSRGSLNIRDIDFR